MTTNPYPKFPRPVARKNPYAAHAKIDQAMLLEMASAFVRGETASQAAKALGVNRNTANRYYQIFRDTLARQKDPARCDAPKDPPIIGLFLTASSVQARLVPEKHREQALCALRDRSGGQKAMAVASGPDWPGYDALGDPGDGRFLLMPGCLVGAAGQERLTRHWQGLRERLCRCRGIPRSNYPHHLMACDMAQSLGPDQMLAKLLAALKDPPGISSE
ncbi:hypothetical protein [Fundidesulfovibrio putealis]|uniref:hypothetical protein n=1 Tax=Fundidesulfovibrio putealis TaxID=270496 RepID=UPI00041F73CF|nr:hypothetical protein [Fundidesulfovibrio putealis]